MSDTPQTSVPNSGRIPEPPIGTGTSEPAFGITRVLKESLEAYSRRFYSVTTIMFIAALPAYAVELLSSPQTGDGDIWDRPATSGLTLAIMSIIGLVTFSLATAFIVQIAFDAKMKRPTSNRAALNKVVPLLLPILLMAFLTSLLIGIGIVALVLPGIYLMGMFAVYVPVIVVERRGFSSLGRSANLTKGYRWPIIGVLVTLYILLFFGVSVLANGLIFGLGSLIGIVTAYVIFALIEAVAYAIISIATVMIYARLLEIKEGVAVDDIAKVFA